MIDGVRIDRLEVKADERGWLAEIMRAENLGQGVAMSQLFMTVGNPGKTKGKHYHTRKTEWFSVVSGNARLYLRDTRSGEEVALAMGENNFVTVTIPPYVAHAISCDGDRPFHLLVVVSEQFDPKDPDTFSAEFSGI